MGGYIYTGICSPEGEGGVTQLYPTGSMSLLGVRQCLVPGQFQGGTLVPGGVVPWGIPQPGQDGVPPSQDRTGYPNQPGQDRVNPPPRTGYVWTDYATGGTPLAVSRGRSVLFCRYLEI